MQKKTIQEVIFEIKERVEKTQRKQAQLNCRTFLRKLGYKARSQRLIDDVAKEVEKQGLVFVFEKGIHSWKEIDPDGTLIWRLATTPTKQPATLQRITCGGRFREYPLYAYQLEAIKTMNEAYRKYTQMRGLLVLPTGGGKTTTAVEWVLPHLLKGKQVLWLAHRHELLEQAYHAIVTAAQFQPSDLPAISYRIISGKHAHSKTLSTEQLVIASKDSLVAHPENLARWAQEQDVIVIVDEAHHAVATTYQQVIEQVRKAATTMQVLGLTATPFRTDEEEKGALKRLFTHDIIFKRDLKTLIAAGMLAEPIFLDLKTDVTVGEEMTTVQKQAIERFDTLPDQIVTQLVKNQRRNHLIVSEYVRNAKKYRKTIIFAINQAHALTLHTLMQQQGVKCGVVISQQAQKNAAVINAFRAGELDILINVNILTEGADFPDVQTVFLARPTTSSILMTQMIGRALRGKAAGGTQQAYIVSFVDDWMEHITWANSQRLVEGPDRLNEAMAHNRVATTRMISAPLIEKITAELAKSFDASRMTHVTFSESVPIGMLAFSYLLPDAEVQVEILVYDHLKEGFHQMRKELPLVCAAYPLTDYPEERVLRAIARELEVRCFTGNYQAPTIERHDLVAIIRRYIQTKQFPPLFYFTERQEVDLTALATNILSQDMGPKKKADFLQHYWHEHKFTQIYFNYNEYYFRHCVDGELLRIELAPHRLEDVSLKVWRKEQPALYRRIVADLFRQARVKGGYKCEKTGIVSADKKDFVLAYRTPLSKGGKTNLQNLQLISKKLTFPR